MKHTNIVFLLQGGLYIPPLPPGTSLMDPLLLSLVSPSRETFTPSGIDFILLCIILIYFYVLNPPNSRFNKIDHRVSRSQWSRENHDLVSLQSFSGSLPLLASVCSFPLSFRDKNMPIFVSQEGVKYNAVFKAYSHILFYLSLTWNWRQRWSSKFIARFVPGKWTSRELKWLSQGHQVVMVPWGQEPGPPKIVSCLWCCDPASLPPASPALPSWWWW